MSPTLYTRNSYNSRGYDYDDLVALFKDDGIKLSKTTLRQYLNEARKARADQEDATEDTGYLPEQLSTQPPENTPAETSEPTVKQAPEEPKRSPKKLGKGRLQSDENSARYPDGHGQPIEIKTDL